VRFRFIKRQPDPDDQEEPHSASHYWDILRKGTGPKFLDVSLLVTADRP
jgi:hypothetical protein